MRRRTLIWAILPLMLGACVASERLVLVTDPAVRPVDVCNLGAAVPPVSGQLQAGRDQSPDYIWLRGSDGVDRFLIWPSGFTVAFEPSITLDNEKGEVVARGGDQLTLTQVAQSAHSGTRADPYPAVGPIGQRCYESQP
jgi:hypothetical protein